MARRLLLTYLGLLAAEAVARWQAAEGPTGSCDVREAESAEDFKRGATEPLLLRFKASDGEVSQEDFLGKFGGHPAALYPRYIMENLQAYKSFSAFVAEYFGEKRSSASTSPAPLVLSFQERYRGADELRAQLKQNYRLPPDWDAGIWSVSLGANSSGIPMHSTHDAVAASVLYGRKRWFLAPPGSLERAKERSVYWDVGPTHRLPAQWPAGLVERLKGAGLGFLECTQEPGTALLVPAWWWHATRNEGDVLSVNAQISPSDSSPSDEPYPIKQAVGSRLGSYLRNTNMEPPPEGSQRDLKVLAAKVVKEDPLQLLRDAGTVINWWRFFAADDAFLRSFAAEVQGVVKWANESMLAKSLMPEQCASLAFNLFPFGVLAGPEFAALPQKHPARSAANGLRKLITASLKAGFADPRYRPHAGILQAAMHAEAGKEDLAQAAMDRHVGKQGLALRVVADFASSYSRRFRKFWRMWLMHNMGQEL